jgi:hypothetical protein
MLDWYTRHGFDKLLLRNIVLAFLVALLASTVTLAVRLEKCQSECQREMIDTVNRLKNERIADMQNVQAVFVRQTVLEQELNEAKSLIADLQKRLKRQR